MKVLLRGKGYVLCSAFEVELGGAWVTALINMASEDNNVRLVGAFAGVGSGEGLELD